MNKPDTKEECDSVERAKRQLSSCGSELREIVANAAMALSNWDIDPEVEGYEDVKRLLAVF